MRVVLGMTNPRSGTGRDLVGWLLTTLPYGVFMYFAVLGCVYAFTYFVEAREREAQQSQLAAQLAEAQLGALRMQLHPHFLFNSLNAIGVLVRDQNTRDASRMLELLGGMLRQVLHGNKRLEVPLSDEVEFIERYLAIEQVRFSDRLRVRWAVDASVRDALVPEFILQPLVENAIRHGLANRADGGTIEVGAHGEGENIVLTVSDDGAGYDPRGDTVGVGLANVRARLQTLYGESGRLNIHRAPRGGTTVMLRFPFHAADSVDG
jgi:LytS/YehU family sensor histidine kinase